MKEDRIAVEFVEILKDAAIKQSNKHYNSTEYAYVCGYIESTVKILLSDLNLTEEQRKIVDKHILSIVKFAI